jgi:lysophospholipase L1-like esterase
MTDSSKDQMSLRRKAAFALIVFSAFWIICEAVLRATGFQFNTNVETMVFTFPIDEYNTNSEVPFLQRDERLFWKPLPNVLGHNSRGMVGPKFSDAKPAGVFRIVCLGDSCTHFGPDSYPEQLQALLNEVAPGRFEVINAGCIGYSSFQGLTQLREQVVHWSPDLVTVYFGWNDHWLAHGYRDSDQRAHAPKPSELQAQLERFRVFQFLQWSESRLSAPATPQMRVALDEYRSNLRSIYQVCSERTINVWYITAPDAFDIGISDYLRTSGEVIDPSTVAELHDSYNEAVRTVTQDLDAVCLDLASQFEPLDKSRLFLDDHIHLSESGRVMAGRALLQLLDDHSLVNESPAGRD